jgi:ribonuclease R
VDESGRTWRVDDAAGAQPGDRVLLLPAAGPRPRGTVLHVLEAERETWVGILHRRGAAGAVTPYRDDAHWRVSIAPRDLADAPDGDVVVVLPQRKGTSPRGRIVEALGPPGTPEADFRAVVWRRRLPTRFAPDAEAAAAALPLTPEPAEIARRVDLRALPFVTVDPATARDHDDAVCVEREPGGAWRLRVAIADVSHYVHPGSPLDREALRRGNSVYFPDRAIPMLPERLASQVCSLLPDEDRLAMVAELGVDSGGRVGHRAFYPAVIRSRARLVYEPAARAMQRDADARGALGREVSEQLDALAAATGALAAHRFAAGSLDFDLPTAEIVLAPDGMPIDVVSSPRTPAHRAVEEAMLAANRAVAELLWSTGMPVIYRNHEPPADEDADALRALLAKLGLAPREGGALTPRRLAQALARAQGRAEERLVHLTVLRRMRQARYGAASRGHYALGFRHYLHFTSPIRRYADLVAHRALKAALGDVEGAVPDVERLHAVAARVSFTERVAEAADREMIQIKKCVFMAPRVGEVFDGSVTGVARHGLYVTLAGAFVEGLVHISALGERVHFDEETLSLVARRSGRRWRLGDPLRVRLAASDPVASRIELALEDAVPGAAVRAPRAGDRSRPRRYKSGEKRGPRRGGPPRTRGARAAAPRCGRAPRRAAGRRRSPRPCRPRAARAARRRARAGRSRGGR